MLLDYFLLDKMKRKYLEHERSYHYRTKTNRKDFFNIYSRLKCKAKYQMRNRIKIIEVLLLHAFRKNSKRENLLVSCKKVCDNQNKSEEIILAKEVNLKPYTNKERRKYE